MLTAASLSAHLVRSWSAALSLEGEEISCMVCVVAVRSEEAPQARLSGPGLPRQHCRPASPKDAGGEEISWMESAVAVCSEAGTKLAHAGQGCPGSRRPASPKGEGGLGRCQLGIGRRQVSPALGPSVGILGTRARSARSAPHRGAAGLLGSRLGDR